MPSSSGAHRTSPGSHAGRDRPRRPSRPVSAAAGDLAGPARGAGAWRAYLAATRPRTLPAAVVPVAVGAAVAHAEGQLLYGRAVLALVVALSMQVGVNFANDYSDGVRGTDAARVGPTRLVASGLASPAAVRAAAAGVFALGAAAGLWLALLVTPWLIAVGAACIAAGWLYTGGPRPYGYAGLGEAFVFVFFGLVATVGTAYVSGGHVSALAVLAAVPVGLLAVALLVVNNLRDIEGDAASGKRTLAVRLGERGTRVLYSACVLGAFAFAGAVASRRLGALVALAAVALAPSPLGLVWSGAQGRDLLRGLALTGRLQLVLGLLLALGVAW